MDLLAIEATLWRHKRVSIPLVLLTVFGVLYVLAGEAPTPTPTWGTWSTLADVLTEVVALDITGTGQRPGCDPERAARGQRRLPRAVPVAGGPAPPELVHDHCGRVHHADVCYQVFVQEAPDGDRDCRDRAHPAHTGRVCRPGP